MATKITFRTIRAEEIDVRVGSTNKDKSGFQLLLYKDARVDCNILDTTLGIENWQCKYYQVKNTMVCSVGINVNYDDPNKEPRWIWKDDGGDDDYQAEKVKAELSDAFKRACFKFSLGRELYNSPFIWIKTTENNTTNSKYAVKEIAFNEKKEFTKLVVINAKTKEVVFSFGSNTKVPQNEQKPQKQRISEEQHEKDMAIINTYLATPNKTQESKDRFISWVERTTGFSDLSNLYTDYLNTNRVANAIREKE